jgi:hypothetical protein
MNSVPQSNSAQSTQSYSRGDVMQQLRRQLAGAGGTAEEWSQSAERAEVFSSGSAAIDRLLPGGSLRHGMLVEWLAGEWSSGVEEQWSRAGEQKRNRGVEQRNKNYSTTPLLHYSSAATLSLLAAREACREGGALVVLDRSRTFYPPAAAAWGIDLDRLIVVRPTNVQDEHWAAVQSLRSPAVAAMWGTIDRLDGRAFRRLQLAAQAGRTLGLFLRPPSARGQPSWADVTLGVNNCGLWIADCGLNKVIRNPQTEIRNHLPRHSQRRIQVRVLRRRPFRQFNHPGNRRRHLHHSRSELTT